MSLNLLIQNIDEWCGTPVPGHPPRPPWLRDILTAVVVADLSAVVSGPAQQQLLHETAAQLFETAAEQVALNPQPLPPVERPTE